MSRAGILNGARRLAHRFEARLARAFVQETRTGPATQATLRHLYMTYRSMILRGEYPALSDAGCRVFSQFDEDGKLLLVFAALGIARGTFLDIGAGDGVNSNCANLALNFGWTGTFIDGDEEQLRRGKRFYERHTDAEAYVPQFHRAFIRTDNVNETIRHCSLLSEIDFLSIDIDGNDYWVWDAITAITPKVVMLEATTEFGLRDIVVPYQPDYVYPGRHPLYRGASIVAMNRLAGRKGYRLVGANSYGFNLLFVRRGLAEAALPEVSVEAVWDHPRNRAREKLFEPISNWEYVEG